MDDHGCIECGQWGHYETQCPQRVRQFDEERERIRAIAAAEERERCIALLMAMATEPGVDWFSGEVLREAAKRLGFGSTEGGSNGL